MNLWKTEPVIVTQIVGLVVTAAASYGLITADQVNTDKGIAGGGIAALIQIAAGLVARSQVRPVTKEDSPLPPITPAGNTTTAG